MLIKCPECMKTVSSTAVSCPNCGFRLDKIKDPVYFESRNEMEKIKKYIRFGMPTERYLKIEDSIKIENEKNYIMLCNFDGFDGFDLYYSKIKIPATDFFNDESMDGFYIEFISLETKQFPSSIDKYSYNGPHIFVTYIGMDWRRIKQKFELDIIWKKVTWGICIWGGRLTGALPEFSLLSSYIKNAIESSKKD